MKDKKSGKISLNFNHYDTLYTVIFFKKNFKRVMFNFTYLKPNKISDLEILHEYLGKKVREWIKEFGRENEVSEENPYQVFVQQADGSFLPIFSNEKHIKEKAEERVRKNFLIFADKEEKLEKERENSPKKAEPRNGVAEKERLISVLAIKKTDKEFYRQIIQDAKKHMGRKKIFEEKYLYFSSWYNSDRKRMIITFKYIPPRATPYSFTEEIPWEGTKTSWDEYQAQWDKRLKKISRKFNLGKGKQKLSVPFKGKIVNGKLSISVDYKKQTEREFRHLDLGVKELPIPETIELTFNC